MLHSARNLNVFKFNRSRAIPLLLCLLIASALTACQPVQAVPANAASSTAANTPSAQIPQVTIKAQDFAFDMPDELPAGFVSITFTNEGQVNHHGYAMRLLEGVTLDQVTAALAADDAEQSGAEPPQINDLAFFLPDTDPGKSNQATVELAPGDWVLVSFSMDPSSGDSTPDWAKGSIQEFTVTDTADTNASESATPPTADVTVTIGADDFDMPTELAAGEQTLEIVNNSGADDGYVFFLKLGGDTTVESTLAAFDAMFAGQEPETTPEVSAVGGLMGYNLGKSYYTTINFEPGNYAAISSINGEEFPYSGLYKNFTVK
jgi:hypothetical protein